MGFKENLQKELPDIEKEKLPGSYQIIGDIILLKLLKIRDKEQKEMIAHVLLRMFPYIKTICEIRQIEGEYREPAVVVLAGNGTETIHKEHGLLYKIDVSKIMFSKGNLLERKRLIGKIKKDETVVDMFAGIGYFSLALSKKAKKVISIEKNPLAFEYLKENIRLNKINNTVPVLADCRDAARQIGKTADRIIMGYFPKTEQFLESAFLMLKENGVIHYHNIYNEDELWEKPLKEIMQTAKSHGYKITDIKKRKVKSYAPHVWHVVLDVFLQH